ncbi:hypothetical protein F503_01733 [Ophiostoma piceae UAMH 11346]|uniref:Uncharacterized protein n=1 Tax=Ophiostoma piceae (strain UAMH 11346) TaxID=1262450 RepID=S3CC36_OPHP1|nr:hypothetical protein F503_01733 [Ophiostoma piceae UAMH 11346]
MPKEIIKYNTENEPETANIYIAERGRSRLAHGGGYYSVSHYHGVRNAVGVLNHSREEGVENCLVGSRTNGGYRSICTTICVADYAAQLPKSGDVNTLRMSCMSDGRIQSPRTLEKLAGIIITVIIIVDTNGLVTSLLRLGYI